MTTAPNDETYQEPLTLSVVVPMYNEEQALTALAARLRPTLDGCGEPYEVLAVDDGSTDATARILENLRALWPQLRVVSLRRNSGHQAALTAGLHRARGSYTVSIDADLQDPPAAIPQMLALARAEGLDVVYGVRADRSTDSVFKRRTAAAYYRLVRRMVGAHVPAQVGDFRLLSRPVLESLKQLPDQRHVYRLLIPSLGFPSGQITYRREERVAGTTKYPLRKMVMLALDSSPASRPPHCAWQRRWALSASRSASCSSPGRSPSTPWERPCPAGPPWSSRCCSSAPSSSSAWACSASTWPASTRPSRPDPPMPSPTTQPRDSS